MDTGELESALRGRLGRRVRYMGVFSSDEVGGLELQLEREVPQVFIANTLESSSDVNNMGHWVCFYVGGSLNDIIIFFDSYGLPPGVYSPHFSIFLERYSNLRMYEFKGAIQPDMSYKCGLYVLFFIHFVSHHGIRRTIQRIKNTFPRNNLQQNDRTIVRYYFTHLKRRRCSEWNSGGRRAITYGECIRDGKVGVRDHP